MAAIDSYANQPSFGVCGIIKRLILSLALVSISFCVLAQTHSSAKKDRQVIQRVKPALASSFDSGLPRLPLEYFLVYETDGAPVKWIIPGCDRQSSGRNASVLRNSPIWVEADFDLGDGETLTVLIRVEESQNEQLPSESLLSLMVIELTGKVCRIRSFVDLPLELHRAFQGPRKTWSVPVTAKAQYLGGV